MYSIALTKPFRYDLKGKVHLKIGVHNLGRNVFAFVLMKNKAPGLLCLFVGLQHFVDILYVIFE